MILNHDCVRDLMLFAEENLNMHNYIKCSTLEINHYSTDELIYAASKLIQANYLEGKIQKYIDGNIEVIVTSITWKGHEFLDNIRDNGVWDKTKNVVGKLSSVSINLISNVAAQIITKIIDQQLEL